MLARGPLSDGMRVIVRHCRRVPRWNLELFRERKFVLFQNHGLRNAEREMLRRGVREWE